jgi:hypothetical protein
MSKNNEDTKLPKPEIIVPIEINTINTILPMNYEALEYISWFVTDSQNVQNWAATIFRGGIDTSDPRLVELLAAANKALQETQDDMTHVKDYLDLIIPTAKIN